MSEVNQSRFILIGERRVGPGEQTFIIAEAGVNHNGDLGLARKLIDIAAESGADAVKFQTFKASDLVTAAAPKADYQLETTNTAESQFEMLQRLELSPADHRELQLHSRHRGILFLSTPFSDSATDFLDELGIPAFKISSGDLTNTPLLETVASKQKPILLSTGMATLAEVRQAVETIRNSGGRELLLLHCVSDYPASPADTNLLCIRTLQDEFNLPIGFSDHSEGIELALAAVALGACLIEKHFTVDRNLPGPDHRASLEPNELRALVKGIRKVEVALGNGQKVPTDREVETARIARRSLVAACAINPGTTLVREMVVLKRPGTGLSPSVLKSLVGRKARVHISQGCMLSSDMFE